jgi:phage replication-related protein YjqB (UPF0714/DUF867 family)
LVEGRSTVAIVAPHAGRIEPWTGEIAEAIAGHDHRFYCFSGRAPSGNRRLHVSSIRFEEAALAPLLSGAVTVVSVHGAADRGRSLTFLGGRNQMLARLIRRRLDAAGFAVESAPARIAGRHPDNLVNRVPGGGVQLELSWDLRHALSVRRSPFFPAEESAQLLVYSSAIRSAVAEWLERHEANAPRISRPAQ